MIRQETESSFGADLKTVRSHLRLTQRQFAEQVGLRGFSCTQISRLERNLNKPPQGSPIFYDRVRELGAQDDDLLLLLRNVTPFWLVKGAISPTSRY